MASEKRVEDFTQETLATLNGDERFVMYDLEEGKTAALSVILQYILGHLSFTDPNSDGNIVVEVDE